MEPERLIHMTNQIATFFGTWPETQAIEATADHLRQFWDPRMRKELLRLLDTRGKDLSPIARQAARRLQP